MTPSEVVRITHAAEQRPNAARAGMIVDAINGLLTSLEPLVSQDMGGDVTLTLTVKPVK